jgi:putative oxidoreductase
LLIIGFFTPLAALGIVSTVTVATIVLMSKGEPFINPAGHSYENSSFYIFAGLAIALIGAGKYSLDRLVFGKRDGVEGETAQSELRQAATI